MKRLNGWAVASYTSAPMGAFAIVHAAASWVGPVRPDEQFVLWRMLGLVLCWLGPAAVVFGIVGFTQAARGTTRGVDYAVAGIVLGLVSSVLVPSQVGAMNKSAPRSSLALGYTCQRNVADMSRAMAAYTNDWDGHLPPARWNGALRKYVKPRTLICPAAEDRVRPSYAMNSKLVGRLGREVVSPDYTVIYFESKSAIDLVGDLSLAPKPARHGYGRTSCGYMDGHVQTWHGDRVSRPNLDPAKPEPTEKGER